MNTVTKRYEIDFNFQIERVSFRMNFNNLKVLFIL